MFDRLQPVAKTVCALLAALLLYQVGRLASARSPLADVQLPDLSVLSAPSNTTTDSVEADPPPVAAGRTGPPTGLPPGLMPPGFSAGGAGRPRVGPALPPEIQARIDGIQKKEILGPVPRPVPLTLLGIAGKDVFLQTPGGPAGLVSEGGELGGVKVLRIGTNRVLVEVEGQTQELTIFSGLGSDSLLPNKKESHP